MGKTPHNHSATSLDLSRRFPAGAVLQLHRKQNAALCGEEAAHSLESTTTQLIHSGSKPDSISHLFIILQARCCGWTGSRMRCCMARRRHRRRSSTSKRLSARPPSTAWSRYQGSEGLKRAECIFRRTLTHAGDAQHPEEQAPARLRLPGRVLICVHDNWSYTEASVILPNLRTV